MVWLVEEQWPPPERWSIYAYEVLQATMVGPNPPILIMGHQYAPFWANSRMTGHPFVNLQIISQIKLIIDKYICTQRSDANNFSIVPFKYIRT